MNRLSDSDSLYLRQHADNPVDWHPWDDSALAAAREQRRPILLSIGYSACHWCHVMAHESFEDETTAQVMNALFVNIKVDREERPDLDKVYQLAHQLLTGRGGGWPLTVFLEPERLTPFFAGTYFPPEPRHGLPDFAGLLRRIRNWYDGNREEVASMERQVTDAITAIQQAGTGAPADLDTLRKASSMAMNQADRTYGGFGSAPKFPQAPLLAALPSLARASADSTLADFLVLTLKEMSRGGLRDHLDGGFFRYTVDGDWTIPHFEKMLYDNALLLPLYAEAAGQNGDPWLIEVATGIADWMTDSLRQPNGGFSSSMDADADGREGGYHVWTLEQIRACLPPAEFAAAAMAFGLDQPPNFEGTAWHLTRRGAMGKDPDLVAAIDRLRDIRAGRVPPATDTKQLASWNALAIDGLARAGVALERDPWLDAAEDCMAFIREYLWKEDSLFAVFANGRASHPAYLDDHAFLLAGTLSLLQARWQPGLLDFATQLADTMLEQFSDERQGGFFFTATGSIAPIHRLRVLQDDATPSGNGIAARALLTLGHLTAEPRYLDAAAALLRSAGTELTKYPLGHASLLMALEDALDPPAQVVIAGTDSKESAAWKSLANRYDRVHCYALAPGADEWPAALGEQTASDGTIAYLCRGLRCLPAIRSKRELEEQLSATD